MENTELPQLAQILLLGSIGNGVLYGEHIITLTSTVLYMYLTICIFRCQITESQAPFHTEQRDGTLNVISKFLYIF